MQKFELAHEPTEGPVYGAGGVIVDRVEKGVWNDGKWYSGSERIPEYELPVTAYVLRVHWEYPG